jgi:hypothetical protein
VRPEQPDTPDDEEDLPLAEPVRPARRTRLIVRVALLAVAAVLTAVFVAAVRIDPYDEDGRPLTMSTHTQLGMPPCNFVVMTGKPCPACGMTTSFALLVRGDVLASLRANWVGTLIAVLWALTLVWAVVSGVRGRPLFVRPGRGEFVFSILVGAVLVLMLGRWAVVLVSG